MFGMQRSSDVYLIYLHTLGFMLRSLRTKESSDSCSFSRLSPINSLFAGKPFLSLSRSPLEFLCRTPARVIERSFPFSGVAFPYRTGTSEVDESSMIMADPRREATGREAC